MFSDLGHKWYQDRPKVCLSSRTWHLFLQHQPFCVTWMPEVLTRCQCDLYTLVEPELQFNPALLFSRAAAPIICPFHTPNGSCNPLSLGSVILQIYSPGIGHRPVGDFHVAFCSRFSGQLPLFILCATEWVYFRCPKFSALPSHLSGMALLCLDTCFLHLCWKIVPR